MKPILCLAFVIALALPAAPALAADTASGHYRMGDQRFEIAAGVAVRVWKDSERETYGVVLGEGPFDPAAMNGALAPVDAIADSAPGESGVLKLNVRAGFKRSLEIDSLIASPGSFNSEGDGTEVITVSDGRIRGEWVKPSTDFSDTSYEITVRFDLPLLDPQDPGRPLPADGGAPGEAYRAFVDALKRRDAKAVMALNGMPADIVEALGEARVIEILEMTHPTAPEIVGGWIDGDRAQLRVSGTLGFGQIVRGRVDLKNDGRAWKVGDSALR